MKRLSFIFFILVFITLTLAACGEEERLAFGVESSKDDVDIRSVLEDDAITFLIYNPSGIGDANMTLKQGKMPAQVQVRIFVQGLENLELTYNDVHIVASAPTRGDGPIIEKLIKDGEETELDEASPYWLQIEALPAEPGGLFFGMPAESPSFLITLPQDFHSSGATEFNLKWVDFYR